MTSPRKATAAGVARQLGEPRQRIAHHVRALADVGLLISAGERRKGNFIEQLYESAASTLVLSPALAWQDADRVRVLADQVSLQSLVDFGVRLQHAAAELLDRATFDGEQIASASVEATVRFDNAEARSAFLDEYLEALNVLIARHASLQGEAYTVAAVVHPHTSPRKESS